MMPWDETDPEKLLQSLLQRVVDLEDQVDALTTLAQHLARYMVEKMNEFAQRMISQAVTENLRGIPIIGPFLGMGMDLVMSNAFSLSSYSGFNGFL